MNSRLTSLTTKKTSAIFLAIVLVTGTIALSSSFTFSFMIGAAQAQIYYDGELDNRFKSYRPTTEYKDNNNNNNNYYNSYEPIEYPSKYTDSNSYGSKPITGYGNDNNYQKTHGNSNNNYDKSQYQSYGKDNYNNNNYYTSSKDSSSSKSVSLNKIKCINDNLNINGENAGDVNISNKGQGTAADKVYLGAYSSGSSGYDGREGYFADGYDNKKKDKGFDCVINNNNTNTNIVVEGGGGNVTDHGNGNVTFTCDENVRACFDAQLNDAELQALEAVFPYSEGIIIPAPQPPLIFTIQSLDEFCKPIQESFGSQDWTDPVSLSIFLKRMLNQAGLDIGVEISQAEYSLLFSCIAEALGISLG